MSISPRGASTIPAIATVRIAPLERWCKTGQHVPPEIAGMLVQINTGVIDITELGERQWLITGGEPLRIMRRFAPGYEEYYFCEHMLEIGD